MTTVVCGDGALALEEARRRRFDVVLLDLMLPGRGGLEVCRELRSRSDVPILVLTARGEEADRVLGLELGADDYLTKPFSSRELLARIQALVRRARGQAGPRHTADRGGRARPRALGIARHAFAGRELDLTAYEFHLLRALAERAGHVLSRERLLELVRGSAEEAFDRSIDVHVSRLRAKLGDDPKRPRLLKTVRGAGYPLAVTDRAERQCAKRRRTLFRRIYLHGLLLLVLVVLALAVAGFLLGRDDRSAHELAAVGSARGGDSWGPFRTRRSASRAARWPTIWTSTSPSTARTGRRLAAGGRRAAPPLSAGETARLHGHPRGPFGRHFVVAASGGTRAATCGSVGAIRPRRLPSSRVPRADCLIVLVCWPWCRLRSPGPSRVRSRSSAVSPAGSARATSRPAPGSRSATRSARWARTFDEMAERLQRLLKGHRELLADVSHELRTPLARIRVSLDLAAEAPSGEARRHLARDRGGRGGARGPRGRPADHFAPRCGRRARPPA